MMNDVYKYDGLNAQNKHVLSYFSVYSTRQLNSYNKKNNDTVVSTGMFYYGNMLYLMRSLF